MRSPILIIATLVLMVGMLAGCVSGKPATDSYTDKYGKASAVLSDREQCERSCNEEFSRCSETSAARDNSGITGPAGLFGASADCRNDLSSCLKGCKSR